MEHRWDETDRGNPNYSGKNLPQCHFVHHICRLHKYSIIRSVNTLWCMLVCNLDHAKMHSSSHINMPRVARPEIERWRPRKSWKLLAFIIANWSSMLCYLHTEGDNEVSLLGCDVQESVWGTRYLHLQGRKSCPPNVGTHVLNYMSLNARKYLPSYIRKWQSAVQGHKQPVTSLCRSRIIWTYCVRIWKLKLALEFLCRITQERKYRTPVDPQNKRWLHVRSKHLDGWRHSKGNTVFIPPWGHCRGLFVTFPVYRSYFPGPGTVPFSLIPGSEGPPTQAT